MEQLNLLRSIPLDDSDQTEKVEALWQRLLAFKSFAGSDLTESRSRRTQAETAREEAQAEVVRSTEVASERMRSEASARLRVAGDTKARAEELKAHAEAEYASAKEAVARGEQEAARLIADAEAQAEQIRTAAREESEREATEFRRNALQEIKSVLDSVGLMQAATREEFETQRVLSDVAKIKSGAGWLMTKADGRLDEQGDLSPGAPLSVVGGRDGATNTIADDGVAAIESSPAAEAPDPDAGDEPADEPIEESAPTSSSRSKSRSGGKRRR